jgi:hypothetical protein
MTTTTPSPLFSTKHLVGLVFVGLGGVVALSFSVSLLVFA